MVEATGQETADETMSAMTNTSIIPMLPEQWLGHQGADAACGFLMEKNTGVAVDTGGEEGWGSWPF